MRPCYCRATRGAHDAPVCAYMYHTAAARGSALAQRNYKLETFAFLFQNSQSSKYNGRSNISSSHSPEVHPQRSCELGGQGQGLVFRVFSQSVSYFTVPPRAHPSTGSQSGSARLPVTNTSTEYSFPGATVLFQISTADKTHVFIPCVCPVLVSVLFRFSRGHPAPRSFFGGTIHAFWVAVS